MDRRCSGRSLNDQARREIEKSEARIAAKLDKEVEQSEARTARNLGRLLPTLIAQGLDSVKR